MAFSGWKNRPARVIASLVMAVPAGMLAAACSGQGAADHASARARPANAAALSPSTVATPSFPDRVRPRSHRTTPLPGAPAPGAGAPVLAAPAGTRLVTFVNKVQQTIWVAASPDSAHPLARTGWVLPAGKSVTIIVPDHWNGRFWGRTGCVFHDGYGRCETGDCGGRFQCAGFGAIPATLAEYDMNAWDGLDFYDVSMVDGANLPMYINITKGGTKDAISPDGCAPAGCTKPVPLQTNIGGTTVSCESACARFGTDQYCCRGAWAPRAACDPAKWPVDYAAVFKTAEPYAYSYVDDDATSVFTCKGECDYRITFGITPHR
jgi:hypothetical protein